MGLSERGACTSERRVHAESYSGSATDHQLRKNQSESSKRARRRQRRRRQRQEATMTLTSGREVRAPSQELGRKEPISLERKRSKRLWATRRGSAVLLPAGALSGRRLVIFALTCLVILIVIIAGGPGQHAHQTSAQEAAPQKMTTKEEDGRPTARTIVGSTQRPKWPKVARGNPATTPPPPTTTKIINNDDDRSTRGQESQLAGPQVPSKTRQQQQELGNSSTTSTQLEEQSGSQEPESSSGRHVRLGQLSKRSPASASPSGGGGGGGGQQAAKLQFLQQLRVSESDLLPFSDFDVQQPAFSDIMKSWPPTRRTSKQQQQQQQQRDQAQAASSRTANGPSSQSHLAAHHNHGGGARGRPQQQQRFFFGLDSSAGDGASEPLARNHLNEDYDDTIVTADESFEQDQLPEPPTWVNYLGELGDFIYAQLGAFFEPTSNKSPFSGQQQQQQQQQPAGASDSAGAKQPAAAIETLDDLLDDFYYDQYENSQVLYYGPQLVRQGDIFEIGCYLPNDQPAEWTKSGRSIVRAAADAGAAPSNDSMSADVNPLRVIKSSNFLGAKQNYSLKVFEAQLSDSGNYRCNRMSRKYHKLIVVPARAPASQLYLTQQRLLSVVGSSLSSQASGSSGADLTPTLSAQQIQLATLYQQSSEAGARNSQQQQQQQQPARSRARQPLTIQASGSSGPADSSSSYYSPSAATSQPRLAFSGVARYKSPALLGGASPLVQGHLIIEQQPLSVQCHISDELVLRKLREMPHFQLAWYKNGKLLRASQSAAPNASAQARAAQQLRAPLTLKAAAAAAATSASTQRIQFLGANGRQMLISAPSYTTDAGDYLCSWAKLAQLLRSASNDPAEAGDDRDAASAAAAAAADFSSSSPMLTPPLNPLSAASQHQLLAPVKLRPFKSAYHVRQNDQLRLVCQVQRGYPAAQISWYVGNRLVDGDFLRKHADEFRVLQLRASGSGRFSVLASEFSANSTSGAGDPEAASQNNQKQAADSNSNHNNNNNNSADDGGASNSEQPAAQIVEINPIPAGRQQMQLTANGRGQWINQAELSSERHAIDTRDKQLRYLQMKLAQLTGASDLLVLAAASSGSDAPAASQQAPATLASSTSAMLQQASLSVLVVNKLNKERHTSRYACRATSRANTDEVTTVIRVKASRTLVMRPVTKTATLVPGEPLFFECQQMYNNKAQFIWYKRNLVAGEPQPLVLLDPNSDDTIQIHNERLTLLRPGYSAVGDYICRALNEDKTENESEQDTIRVRAPPRFHDFGVETSHTGQSATVTDGEKLELLCRVRDETAPVNISWLMSTSPDNDHDMRPVTAEHDPKAEVAASPNLGAAEPGIPSYSAQANVVVQRVDAFAQKLIIREVRPEHRGTYACIADNRVTERVRKDIYIRVKDKIVALWPFLGILAELFILFTIIYVWETQRAQKTLNAKAGATSNSTSPRSLVPPMTPGASSSSTSKRPASGPSNAFESVPLNG